MSHKKKFFVMSDLHGHYSLAKQALDDAGFDPNNEDHVFVHCGDLFDRGDENKKVFELVSSLKNKILVMGNHDERLNEVLTKRIVSDIDFHNGMYSTLTEFFGENCMDYEGNLFLSAHIKTVYDLRMLVSGMYDYYETENYVFVHGWVPLDPYAEDHVVLEDWRTANSKRWHDARWTKWFNVFKDASLPDKTIVCGHRPTLYAHQVDKSRDAKDSSIYYAPGMIAIDAGTVRSGRVNLLVFEDNLLPHA